MRDQWIKEEKSGFLVRALENLDTPLGEIIEAVERYRHTAIEETELSHSTQKGLRVSLIRRFFSENLEFINVAKNFIDGQGFLRSAWASHLPAALSRQAGRQERGTCSWPRRSLRKPRRAGRLLRKIKVPRTWYVTSDWILNFVHHNELEDVLNRKYMEIDQVRQEYPHLVALFKSSSFPSELAKGLSLALDELGDRPLIVRSSSLLEDRAGRLSPESTRACFWATAAPKRSVWLR